MNPGCFPSVACAEIESASGQGGDQAGKSVCEVALQLFVAYQVLEIYIVFPLPPVEKKHSSVLALFMGMK